MEYPQRKRTRLKGFDYTSDNYYFVTICTHEKKCIFGSAERLTACGLLVKRALEDLPQHFENISVDQYVVMPNHVHAVIILGCEANSDYDGASLSTIIGSLKAAATKSIHQLHPQLKVWQTSFYDSIIRSRVQYDEITRYIAENPIKWTMDKYYCDN